MQRHKSTEFPDLDMSFQSENLSEHGELGAGIYALTKRVRSSSKQGSTLSIQQADRSKDDIAWSGSPKSKRTIVIEPALALMFTLVVSSAPLTGQYVYWAIGEQYNLTSVLEEVGMGSERQTVGCGSKAFENTSAYRLQQKVQAETAEFALVLDLCTDIPGIIVSLFMGTFMDNFGRKPALILPLIGVILQCLVFVIQQAGNLSLYLMILGTVINALSGGMGTFINACYSYYSDTIPPSKRGRRIITADLVYGLLLAVGQVSMGYLIQSLGFLYPYIIIITGHTVNLLYVIFFVPESKEPTVDKKPVSPKYILETFKVLTRKRPRNDRRVLLTGILARGVTIFFVRPRLALLTLYLLNSPLCWNSTLIGNFTAFSLVFGNLSQLFLTIFLLGRLQEIGCVILSIACATMSVAFLAFSTTTWMVFIGALFACLSATSSIVSMVGGLVFNALYASTLLVFKGTAFIVMTGGLLVALVIFLIFRRDFKKNAKCQKDIYPVPQDPVFSIT